MTPAERVVRRMVADLLAEGRVDGADVRADGFDLRVTLRRRTAATTSASIDAVFGLFELARSAGGPAPMVARKLEAAIGILDRALPDTIRSDR